MRKQRIIMATTHVDAHNESISPEGLRLMADDLSRILLPVWVQHDPRLPPVGRVLKGEVKQIDDGELAVEAEIECWAHGDPVPFICDRRMPLGKPGHERLFAAFDRGFCDEQSQTTLRKIEATLGCEPQPEVKKALEPLTILTLGGTFLAGAIASGFFGQIGSDAYGALKEQVKQLLRRKKENEPQREVLFLFKAFLRNSDEYLEIDLVITNPTDEDIEHFLEEGLHLLDSVVPALLHDKRDIQRIVLELADRRLLVRFAVRSDAAPIFPVVRE